MEEYLKPFVKAGLASDDPDDRTRKIVAYLGAWVAHDVGLADPDGFITPEFLIFKLDERFPIFALGLATVTDVVSYLDQDMDSELIGNHSAESYLRFSTYFSERLARDIKLQDEMADDDFGRLIEPMEAADPHAVI